MKFVNVRSYRWLVRVCILALGLFVILKLSERNIEAIVYTNPTATQDATASLQELANEANLLIGTAVQAQLLSQPSLYTETLNAHFGVITPENEMKLRTLQPQPGQFDFEQADIIMTYAQANEMAVRGHTLIWHNAIPSWLANGNFSQDELLAIMETHIKTVVERYKGKIYAWDVVNEAIASDGSSLRENIYYRVIGSEYIALSFQWAHEADPDALLFYSDYSISDSNTKSDWAFQFLSDLLAEGVPIHGVAFHMHINANSGIDVASIQANFERFASLGLELHISELDVRLQDLSGTAEERLMIQAEIYRDVLTVCLKVPNCTTFAMWGFTDAHSWIHRRYGPDAPLIFDANYRPKPAYFSLVEALTSISN